MAEAGRGRKEGGGGGRGWTLGHAGHVFGKQLDFGDYRKQTLWIRME